MNNSGLILPKHVLKADRKVPAWFTTGLEGIDRALFVLWNPNRERWVIARCVRDDNTLHAHDPHVCPQTLVMIVQSELCGGYVPLTEQTLDKLRSMDMWKKYGSPEKMLAALEAEEQVQNDKIQRDQREDIEHCGKDGRVQLNKMKQLVETHNLTINK